MTQQRSAEELEQIARYCLYTEYPGVDFMTGSVYPQNVQIKNIVQALKSYAAQEAKPLERELREFYWLNHGHGFVDLYGDDGEMQCQTCVRNGHRHWDYLRAPFDEIRTQYGKVHLEEVARSASKLRVFTADDVRPLVEALEGHIKLHDKMPHCRIGNYCDACTVSRQALTTFKERNHDSRA